VGIIVLIFKFLAKSERSAFYAGVNRQKYPGEDMKKSIFSQAV